MFTELVAILALLQFFGFGLMVGRTRRKTGVKAPATTGNPMFERAFRVQMNTMELLVMFLPALFLAVHYWSDSLVAVLGAVYILGRHIYWRDYITNPATRHLGFALSALPILILLALGLIGAVMSLVGAI
ncbi:MAG: MAPEG family protein [Hydrotalea sp.]|nr:MAPEG family protein [Hydrotalea sp.]